MQSTCQHDQARPHRRIVIVALVTAHLVAAVMLGTCVRLFDLSSDEVVGVLFVGLAFAQAGCVGLWCALGSTSWPRRLSGLILGIVYLALGFAFAVDQHDWETYFVFSFATIGVTAVLSILRYLGFQLSLVAYENQPPRKLQFGIRHLLVLTLVTGLTLAVVINLEIRARELDMLPHVTLLTLHFMVIATVMPWAVLGQTRFPLRTVVLLIVTSVVSWSGGHLLGWIPLRWMLLAEAALLIVTLLVARVCGYRLVKLDKGTTSG